MNLVYGKTKQCIITTVTHLVFQRVMNARQNPTSCLLGSMECDFHVSDLLKCKPKNFVFVKCSSLFPAKET